MSAITGSVGASIGKLAAGTFGWTAATWSQIGWTAGVLAGTYLFAPDGPNVTQEGPRLGDLKVTSSAYGIDIPKVYGAYRISGNIIWSLPLQETRHEEKQESGKGGGGSSSTSIWYTYKATFAVALCEGPISGIRKIWFGSKLVYDNGTYSTPLSGDLNTVYLGTSDQEIDWIMDNGSTPAYRSVAYIVFRDIELEDLGNAIPNVTVEAIKSGTLSSSITYPYTKLIVDNGLVRMPTDDYMYTADNNGALTLYKVLEYIPYKVGLLTIPSNLVPTNEFDLYSTSDPFYLATDNISRNDGISEYKLVYVYNGIDPDPYIYKNILFNINDNISSSTTSHYYHNNVMYLWVHSYLTGTSKFYVIDLLLTDSQLTDDINQCVLDGGTTTFCEDQTYNAMPYQTEFLYFNIPPNVNGFEWNTYDVRFNNDKIYIFRRIEISAQPGNTYTTSYRLEMDVYYINDPLVIIDTIVLDSSIYVYNGSTASNDTKGGRLHSKLAISDSSIYIGTFNLVYQLDINTGELLLTTTVTTSFDTFNMGMFASSNILTILDDAVTPNNDYIEAHSIGTLDSSGASLGYIVEDLEKDSGLNLYDIDNSAGTINVKGYAISRNMSARTSIEPLLSAYGYSLVEYDFKIVLRDKKRLPDYIIKEEDLGANRDNKLEYNITQESDLIKSLTVRYANSLSDYQTSSQMVRRIDVKATNELIVDLPLSLSDNEAKGIAEKELYKNWASRYKFSLELPFEYRYIIAGDIITLNYNGYSKEVLVTKIVFNDDLSISCSGVANSYGTFTSNAIGGDTGNNTGTISEEQGETILKVLDMPTLSNTYINTAGLYVTASGYTDSWKGCTVYSKTNELDDFSALLNIISPSFISKVQNVLPASSPLLLDSKNSILVSKMLDTSLSSITYANLLNGNNYALVGKEILQFSDVSIIDNNTYELKNLLRGRRGTEDEINNHVAFEDFIYIGSISSVSFIDELIGSNKKYTAVTFGGFIDSLSYETVNYLGKNLKPFSVSRLYGTSDISNNINITWKRRSRYVSGYMRILPLSESTEQYNIDVYDGLTFIKTYTSTVEQFSYLASTQSTDGLVPGLPITFKISQLSSVVGKGLEITIIV